MPIFAVTAIGIAIYAVAAVVFTAMGAGLVLVARDTIRGEGKWGINLKPTKCANCGTPAPVVRVPEDAEQAMWGGATCRGCGARLDKWGKVVAMPPGKGEPDG